MKKKVIKRALSVILIGVLTCSMFTGCNKTEDGDLSKLSKDELIEKCNYYLSCYTDTMIQLDDAKMLIEQLQGYSSTGPSFSAMTIENDKLSFNSYDGKIIFPSEFGYPGAKETAASTSISLTNKVKVNPGPSWIMKLSGSTLELEHTTGVSAMIKIGEFNELYNRDNLKEEVLAPWFEQVKTGGVKYASIFVSGDYWGEQAQTPIQIDGEDAYLVCGIVGFAETSITYIATYRGEQDATKDGIINALINSIELAGNALVVSND